MRFPFSSSLNTSMPYFLVSLLKSNSLALRDLRLSPYSQVGALTLFSSAARTNGRCGARNVPSSKHARPTSGICTRLDMVDLTLKHHDISGETVPHKREGRSSRARLTRAGAY